MRALKRSQTVFLCALSFLRLVRSFSGVELTMMSSQDLLFSHGGGEVAEAACFGHGFQRAHPLGGPLPLPEEVRGGAWTGAGAGGEGAQDH